MPGRGTNRTAAMPRHAGWWRDGINNRLVAVFDGTEIFDFDGNDLQTTQPLTSGGTLTATGVLTANAELRVAEGFNLRVGTISAFGTTEPTDALVFRAGTAPAGAITTAGGIFTDGTTVKKIIAAGTVSDVQT